MEQYISSTDKNKLFFFPPYNASLIFKGSFKQLFLTWEGISMLYTSTVSHIYLRFNCNTTRDHWEMWGKLSMTVIVPLCIKNSLFFLMIEWIAVGGSHFVSCSPPYKGYWQMASCTDKTHLSTCRIQIWTYLCRYVSISIKLCWRLLSWLNSAASPLDVRNYTAVRSRAFIHCRKNIWTRLFCQL